MLHTYFPDLRDKLAHHSWESGGGVSAVDIGRAEDALGPLPADYKYFLSEFGWLTFGCWEVYGLGCGIPKYRDVVEMTICERSEPAVPLPPTFVCIMNDGAGNLISFDVESVVKGRGNASTVL
ncbi:SMI1/KNR4 family protein [Nocardia halotolerans]|uniref:SMI1/KNR4 family protein n=1 Tax=Nocardia halotolerans TaxID=1755878 RepID=A0ABV8VP25_9NOCA